MRIQTLLTGLVVTLFAASVTMPIAAQADDAASLLAKHRAFVGWQYGDGSVQSLYLERTYTDASGKVAEHATERRIGIPYRRDYQTSMSYKEGGSTGFTGSVFWKTTQNGFTVPMIGDIAKYYLAVDALFMEGSSELPAALQSTATVDGKSVAVIRITMNGALPYDVYEDAQTGAFVRAVIDPGGSQEMRFNIATYTTIVPGKKLIGTWSLDDDKGMYEPAGVRFLPARKELRAPRKSGLCAADVRTGHPAGSQFRSGARGDCPPLRADLRDSRAEREMD